MKAEPSVHQPVELDHNDDDGKLLCPVCAFEYVHFDSPVYLAGRDAYDSGTGYRGDAIRIPCWCENDHRWNLFIAFHKGQSFIWLEVTA